MPELIPGNDLHFLRPLWLLLIPLALLLHWRLRRAYRSADQWRGVISDHLVSHLSVSAGDRRRIRPYQLQTVLLVIGSIAVAGPAWEREITPFTEDRAPLVAAIELTDSMMSVDQQPTRLDRVKLKMRDLLEARQGARTAVIAYSGSAHAVLPLTDDAQLLEIYLDALVPDIMPRSGEAPDQALALAARMLEGETAAGTILFLGDGIDRSLADTFERHALANDDQVILWAFGTEAGGPVKDANRIAPGVDLGGLNAIAGATGGSVIRASADSSDVESILRRVNTHLVSAIDDDENLDWHDAGYYFLWPLAFLSLLWARRGWTVVWP